MQRFVFTTDVEKMYKQVLIAPVHRQDQLSLTTYELDQALIFILFPIQALEFMEENTKLK